MKAKLTIAISALIILVACNKDKFQDEPHITIKSISPTTVSNGNIIEMNGKFTDANGDLDSALVVYKWYNGTLVTKADTFRQTFKELNLPSKTKDGDINVTFAYNVINTGYVAITGVQRDTTATFGLILVDKAAHRSNYSESDRIRLKKV
jgi:hypothetical protein